MNTQVASFAVNCRPEIVRPLAKFVPNIWGDRFISFTADNSTREAYAKQIEVLKEEVRTLLTDGTCRPAEKLNLINSLQRLGVSYHFEKEIEDQLEQIFAARANFDDDNDYDLYTTALQFRVLRQQGYKMPCDVFKKFTDRNGKFKETLTSDMKGMLGLYEAAHLGLHGEDILEEAIAFTTAQLESMKAQLSPPLAKQVIHALKRPVHKITPRLEAWHYISVYQEDESRNASLLKFAKLDFNLLQLLHREELSHVSKWWKDLDFGRQLSYARNRVVECYFWILGAYFEPHYALARIILTKAIAMMSILDDTYDAYGTLDELKPFTDAIQRWDISAIDQLPDYMKVSYRALLNLYKEFEEEVAKEGRSYSVDHTIEAVKEVSRSYYLEAKWFNERYVPTFDEYLGNALITTAYHMLITASFIGMGEIASEAVFDWLKNKPKASTATEIICRLMDDIVSRKFEQSRGHVATGIECYTKQYGVSEQEAIDEFRKRISDAWKDINEACLRPTAIPMPLLTRILNLVRAIDVIYRYEDGYTNAALNDYIISLFVDPMPM